MLLLRFGVLADKISMYKVSVWTDNFNFMTEICPKRVFPVKNEKLNSTIELCMFELV